MPRSTSPKPMSLMRHEIDEIPDVLRRLAASVESSITPLGKQIRNHDPRFVATIARGSSDHAASYLSHCIQRITRLPVASIGPSISSIYGITLKESHSLSLSISQSGMGPDVTAATKASIEGGAMNVALVNDLSSNLALLSPNPVNICAGSEQSVAATKSFVATVATGLWLLAAITNDDSLTHALSALPERADLALNIKWDALLERMYEADELYILGRGPTTAIAEEAALKCKETCQLHAEAFSSAEVLHGPMSLVSSGFPILVLSIQDAAERNVAAVADSLVEKGGSVFTTGAMAQQATILPSPTAAHPLTDALMMVIVFYAFAEALAVARGLNPDSPPNLVKVTRTR